MRSRSAYLLFLLATMAMSAATLAGIPSMTLTYPGANSIVDEALTPIVRMQASVTSTDQVTSVIFWVCASDDRASCAGNSGTLVGIATAAPYFVDWTPARAIGNTAMALQYLAWLQVNTVVGTSYQPTKTPFTLLQPPPSPSVKLIAPGGSSGFVAPASPLLYATAAPGSTAPASTIAQVDFLDGPSVIGTVAASNVAPSGYALLWSNAAPGAHRIAARATDSLGDSTTSAAISLYVVDADQPPRAVLNTPASGQVYPPASVIPLAAAVTAGTRAIQRVEFVAGNTVIATTYAPPHVGSWINPPAGNWTIVARAFDELGLATVSPAAYVQVLATPRPPIAVMTAPIAASTVPVNAPLALAATALAPDGAVGRVDFYAGSALIGSATTTPYGVSWANPVAGAQSLSAKAIDVNGTSATSAPLVINVGTAAPPVVTLNAPAAGAIFVAPATIAFSASASAAGGGIVKVEFLANGSVVGTRTIVPFAYNWMSVAAGTYSLTARATSSTGLVQTSSSRSITVNPNVPPTVALTAPVSGATFVPSQPIAMTASATDAGGSIVKVDFLVDSVVVGSVTAAPYAQTWYNPSIGNHLLAVRATDNGGATTLSAGVAVSVVAGSPPTVTIAAPVSGQMFSAGGTINLLATASSANGAVTRVDFYDGAVLIGSVSSSPYALAWKNVLPGNKTITAKATDALGVVAASSSVLVRVVALGLTITTPLSGVAIPNDAVLVMGTYQGPPNTGITVNGIVANTDGAGHYFVNNLPLAPGPNQVRVQLTTLDGQTLTQTRSLTSAGAGPMLISVDADVVFAPAKFSVEVSNRTARPIVNVTYVNLTGGTVDVTGANQSTLGTITYSTPGIYVPSVVVTDSAGATYTQAVALLAQDKAALDAMLKTMFTDLTKALVSGDKAGAMLRLSQNVQSMYEPMFDELLPHFAQIIPTWSAPATGSLSSELGEFAIKRIVDGASHLYLVYLRQDSAGVWHVDSM